MSIAEARKQWGSGHENFSDRQMQDLLDLMYAMALATYEKQIPRNIDENTGKAQYEGTLAPHNHD